MIMTFELWVAFRWLLVVDSGIDFCLTVENKCKTLEALNLPSLI
jgi:hypothetical protein